jgi:hypothetical protein
MTQNTTTDRAAPRRRPAWSLKMELELCGDPPRAASAEQVEALVALLDAAEDVSLAAAEANPRTRVVRVSLTVAAPDLGSAHDRACALVHDHLGRAGLAPAILVAVRPVRQPATHRRMG